MVVVVMVRMGTKLYLKPTCSGAHGEQGTNYGLKMQRMVT